MAIYYKWQVDKIAIYPYGGCVKFKEQINKPLYEELKIMLAGPLIQIVYFLVIVFLYNRHLISLKDFLIFKNYHYSLLFFNLLPVLSLDGGQLLNILISYCLPYKKSLRTTITISYLTIITGFMFILIYYKNFSLLSMLVFILSKVLIESKKVNHLYNKFLLERYLNRYYFKKYKLIQNKNNMFKGYRHIIKNSNTYVTEKEYLKKRFSDEK